MDCKTARSHLSLYLDAALDATVADEFHQHLSDCATCAARFDAEVKAEKKMAAVLGRPTMPEDVWSQLRSNVNKDALMQEAAPSQAHTNGTRASGETQRGWMLPVSLSAAAAIAISVWGFWPVQPTRDYSTFWHTELASIVALEPTADAVSNEAAIADMLRQQYGVVMMTERKDTHGHPIRVLSAETAEFAGRQGLRLKVNCCGQPVVVTLLASGDSKKLPNAVRSVVDLARKQDQIKDSFKVGVERVGNYDAIIFSEHKLEGMRDFLKRADA